MKTSIIAIANQKGGVGKTATAVNLAASYARLKRKTLLIDFDYQGNATANFGMKFKAKELKKVASVSIGNGVPIAEAILHTDDPNLHLIAGDMGLSKLSRDQILEPGSEMMLKNWLDSPAAKTYEVIIIDTHPNLDLLFQMAMTASNYYLVPMFAEADPFDGLKYMFQEISKIKVNLNRQLFFLGLVITKFDRSNATHRKFSELLNEFCEEHKFAIRGIVPDSNAISSSSSVQKPLLWHMPKLAVTKSYYEIAEKLLPELKGARMGAAQATPNISDTPAAIANLFNTSKNAVVF